MTDITNINSTLQGIVKGIANWVTAFNGRNVAGSFTLSAGTTTVVPQPAVQGTSFVVPFATNTAAATLMGSARSLFVSGLTPGTGFAVSCASGTATGTEVFSYVVFSPM